VAQLFGRGLHLDVFGDEPPEINPIGQIS
jgi:hypothetical protein